MNSFIESFLYLCKFAHVFHEEVDKHIDLSDLTGFVSFVGPEAQGHCCDDRAAWRKHRIPRVVSGA